MANLIKQGAKAHGFDSDLWTLSRIRSSWPSSSGVSFSISHLPG
ncbi:MAG: hypothetical protein M5U28_28275 [Sandaracinaceae bacterium]|nr:hypothetical protein [Sandaracinaceae bacterium]